MVSTFFFFRNMAVDVLPRCVSKPEQQQLLTVPCSILCSEYAIKRIDEPFIGPDDDVHEWAL